MWLSVSLGDLIFKPSNYGFYNILLLLDCTFELLFAIFEGKLTFEGCWASVKSVLEADFDTSFDKYYSEENFDCSAY